MKSQKNLKVMPPSSDVQTGSKEGWTQWRLKSGADRRFRSGHPWVYSNELSESPKAISPGAPVELRDAAGKFLARGYGNPHSLIAFRCLSRDEARMNPLAQDQVADALIRAGKIRESLGLLGVSYRLCFGESDELPGLVIDRYRLIQGQVFVVQAHTAGADRLIPQISEILETYVDWVSKRRSSEPSWSETAIVIRNDLGVRKLEGLEEEEPRVIREIPGVSLSSVGIRVRSASRGEPIKFQVDLIRGQKTGFFLDQSGNIELVAARLAQFRPQDSAQPLKILDLCCYVGQWGAQLARVFQKQNIPVEITLVDASVQALELARQNVEAQGVVCHTLRGNVLKDLESIEAKSFDLIISDPPALIQGRKDIPAGTHAYLQLNTQVFRLLKNHGAAVCCSCSGLLEEEAFMKVLSKAAYRNQRGVRWVARGTQSPDHPMRLEFPEGRYLKSWIGIAED